MCGCVCGCVYICLCICNMADFILMKKFPKSQSLFKAQNRQWNRPNQKRIIKLVFRAMTAAKIQFRSPICIVLLISGLSSLSQFVQCFISSVFIIICKLTSVNEYIIRGNDAHECIILNFPKKNFLFKFMNNAKTMYVSLFDEMAHFSHSKKSACGLDMTLRPQNIEMLCWRFLIFDLLSFT